MAILLYFDVLIFYVERRFNNTRCWQVFYVLMLRLSVYLPFFVVISGKTDSHWPWVCELVERMPWPAWQTNPLLRVQRTLCQDRLTQTQTDTMVCVWTSRLGWQDI